MLNNCIDIIGHAKFVSTFDLSKVYWQLTLTQRVCEITAFISPNGIFQYTDMPFGMKSDRAKFKKMINDVIKDLDWGYAYILII